ncbi:MAG: NYN domain-containing protein [Spiroplasma phoeniceum]|nr:MAG: NYN domain-containing protein [Spiroplasma phoeniceum]
MEWLTKDYVDCFCLATNDLDFVPIVRRIKQKNKTVIG